MKVALIRGHQVNPFELQTYEPLLSRGFSLTAFASRAPLHEIPAGIRVERLASPMDAISASRGLVRRAREAYAYRAGTASRLEGLEDALAGHDVYHAVETFNASTVQAADAAARHGKPLVVTVWENVPFLPLAPAFEAHRERTLREARAFVAVTERARTALLLEGAPEERVHVVPVGIDLARFRPAPRPPGARDALGLPEDALVLLFAARLTWEKGLLDLLHALKLQDLRRGPAAGAFLLVAGAGEQEREARRRAARLGLLDRVRFLGHLPYSRMPELYAAADALALPSIPTPRWQEQYGMVLVEAMASGLPVVAGASGSIPEVVGDAGLLAQPNDATSLADAIGRLADPALRADLAKRGRGRAERLFDRERVADRLATLYRGL